VHVVEAEFVTSAASAAGVPRDAPQVAMVGRSNVGKSTLINALLRQRLARTSAAAGKTRLLNFYRVTFDRFAPVKSLYLVDLPGYGYARGGEAAQEGFRVLLESYFGGANPPAAVLQLVDARHPGLPPDVAAWDWIRTLTTHAPRLDDTGRAITNPLAAAVVATKIDKLSRAERRRVLDKWTRQLNAPVLPVSAATGEGMTDLWTLIVRLLRPQPPKASEKASEKAREPSAPTPATSSDRTLPLPSDPSAPSAPSARNDPNASSEATARSGRTGVNDRTAATGPTARSGPPPSGRPSGRTGPSGPTRGRDRARARGPKRR
jgi:GTP-binding protein